MADFQTRIRTTQYHTRYEVGGNPIGQYDENDIQTAIDKAINDGADGDNPAVIFVYAGTYNEVLTLNEGISIIGKGGQVTIVGDVNITCDSLKPCNFEISNVQINGVVTVDGSSTSSPARIFSKFSKFIGGIDFSAFTSYMQLELDSCVVSRNADKPIVQGASFGLLANHCEFIRTPFAAQDLLVLNKASKVTNSTFTGGKVASTGSEQFRVYNSVLISFNQEAIEYGNTNNSNEFFNSTIERRGTSGVAMVKSNTGTLELDNCAYRGAVVTKPINITGGVVNGGQRLVPVYSVQTTNNTLTPITSIAIPTDQSKSIKYVLKGRNSTTGATMVANCFFAVKNVAGVVTLVGTLTSDRKSDFTNSVQSSVTVSGTSAVINITGATGQTIVWDLYITENY